MKRPSGPLKCAVVWHLKSEFFRRRSLSRKAGQLWTWRCTSSTENWIGPLRIRRDSRQSRRSLRRTPQWHQGWWRLNCQPR